MEDILIEHFYYQNSRSLFLYFIIKTNFNWTRRRSSHVAIRLSNKKQFFIVKTKSKMAVCLLNDDIQE